MSNIKGFDKGTSYDFGTLLFVLSLAERGFYHFSYIEYTFRQWQKETSVCFPFFPGLLEIDAHVIAWGRDSASLEADDLRLADGIKYL